MPVHIERVEGRKPNWVPFGWEILRQQISGFYTELPGSTDELKHIRLAVQVRTGCSVNISIENIDHRRRRPGESMSQSSNEQCYIISWWSHQEEVGGSIIVPRELAMPRLDQSTVIIQVRELLVFSNKTGYEDIEDKF